MSLRFSVSLLIRVLGQFWYPFLSNVWSKKSKSQWYKYYTERNSKPEAEEEEEAPLKK